MLLLLLFLSCLDFKAFHHLDKRRVSRDDAYVGLLRLRRSNTISTSRTGNIRRRRRCGTHSACSKTDSFTVQTAKKKDPKTNQRSFLWLL